MTIVLQWTALAVCFGALVWRLPSAIKGRNVSMFWCMALLTVAVGLSIPDIYVPADKLLGGVNIANLLLRLVLLVLLFILAGKIAAAYKSPVGVRMIRGPVGLAVVAVLAAGILVAFFSTPTPESSTGLNMYLHEPGIMVYAALGRVYQAYVAACLVVPTFRGGLRSRLAVDRAAALCLSVGFLLMALLLPMQVLRLATGTPAYVVSYLSILCVAVGLALVWVSYLRRPVTR
ncbi:hypothetical protein [Specibacter cremeus]|uniref:hypothetical protein n=1 Tax=Specibacter cremeus TaxID=1629051 RepID=UPI000F77BC5F|nr:hypothetical protein [Specibacter cremeus]